MKEQDAEPIKHDMPPRPQSNRSKTLEGHKGFKRLKQKEVLQRFWNKHKDKYSYHQMVYKNKRTKVRVWCKKCEEYFDILPHSHMRGQGCPICKLKGVR